MSLVAKGTITKAQNNVNRAISNGDSVAKYMKDEILEIGDNTKVEELADIYRKRDEENKAKTEENQLNSSQDRAYADFGREY